VIEKWRVEYNTRRPHSALGYRSPAPSACSPWNRPNQDSQSMAVNSLTRLGTKSRSGLSKLVIDSRGNYGYDVSEMSIADHQ
jgi:Integrase core domain